MNGPSNLPIRRPIVVTADDLDAIGDRLERGEYADRDLVVAARLCQHARVWIGKAAVSLQ